MIEGLLVDPIRSVAFVGLERFDRVAGLLHPAGHEPAHGVTLPIHFFHQFDQRGAILPLQQRHHLGGLAALAGSLSLRFCGFRRLGGLFSRCRLLRLGRRASFGLAAFGAFLALGRALLRAGSLLRGCLLRRDVGALSRNGGDCVGGSGFCVFRWSFSFCLLLR